jgi:hypothetical protein
MELTNFRIELTNRRAGYISQQLRFCWVMVEWGQYTIGVEASAEKLA